MKAHVRVLAILLTLGILAIPFATASAQLAPQAPAAVKGLPKTQPVVDNPLIQAFNVVPALVVQGDADTIVTTASQTRFVEELERAGSEVSYLVLKGVPHKFTRPAGFRESFLVIVVAVEQVLDAYLESGSSLQRDGTPQICSGKFGCGDNESRIIGVDRAGFVPDASQQKNLMRKLQACRSKRFVLWRSGGIHAQHIRWAVDGAMQVSVVRIDRQPAQWSAANRKLHALMQFFRDIEGFAASRG